MSKLFKERERLLVEARRRFKIGDYYNALTYSGDVLNTFCLISHDPIIRLSRDGSNKTSWSLSCGFGYIYSNGKWADKIADPSDLVAEFPEKNVLYRHFKGGIYEVKEIGIDTLTGDPTVIYTDNTTWFTRLVSDWCSLIVDSEGFSVKRFKRC